MNNNETNYTDRYMISFKQAIRCILDITDNICSEKISPSNAKGRVLSRSILSPADVPSFNNSAMDGYSVNASDLVGASKDNPIELELAGLTTA